MKFRLRTENMLAFQDFLEVPANPLSISEVGPVIAGSRPCGNDIGEGPRLRGEPRTEGDVDSRVSRIADVIDRMSRDAEFCNRYACEDSRRRIFGKVPRVVRVAEAHDGKVI